MRWSRFRDGPPHHVDGCGPAGPALERRSALARPGSPVRRPRPPRGCAPLRGSRCLRLGRPCRPRRFRLRTHRHRMGRRLNASSADCQPDRRALHDEVGRLGAARPRGRRARRPVARPARASGSRPARPPRRPCTRACTAARPAPPAPSTSARRPRGSWRGGDRPQQAGHVRVVGRIARPRNVSVFAAPTARAVAVASSASASAASLCGIVTLTPRKPARVERPHRLGEQLGRASAGAGSASRARPELAQGGVVHRRRARVGDRPAAHAQPRQHLVGRLAAGGLALGVVARAVARELRVGARERVLAARPRLDHVEEVVLARGLAAALIDARPGLPIGVGGRPRFRRVLYGPGRSSSDTFSGRVQLFSA